MDRSIPCIMVKSKTTLAERGFLKGIDAAELRRMHKKEKNPKARDRLLAYAMRKEGMSVYAIANYLNKPYSTIRDWLGRAVRNGLDGIHDKKNPGATCKLTPGQLEQLRADLIAGPDKCGFASSLWTAPLLAAHVRKRFGVEYAVVSMYKLLHRMGFSSRRPRPRHPKSASKSAQTAFKKKLEVR